VGHAIAAVSLAAAGLGWQVSLLEGVSTKQLSHLLGISDSQGVEAEHPDCLLAVYPQGQDCLNLALPEQPLAEMAEALWQGQPNQLSQGHVRWPIIDVAAAATEKLPTDGLYDRTIDGMLSPRGPLTPPSREGTGADRALSLRRIIRQRRSAVAMDGRGWINRDAFYQILLRTVAGPGRIPFSTLPWHPLAHLVLFVHRVEELEPGLYLLVRRLAQKEALQEAMKSDFAWERPASCPAGLELFRLAAGDVQAVARQLSCQQAIASDGCFSLGMIAEFEEPLERFGAWFYRRLFWECGLIGQVLYLEAEAAGVRGTGIGCFFDDGVHQVLGLETARFQSLYHFTIGHPIEDTRLTTLPAYP
jgi:nitroreductase